MLHTQEWGAAHELPQAGAHGPKPPASAMEARKSHPQACRLLVLALLVAQNSSLVLTASYSRHREGPLYSTTVLVFLGECVKFAVSLVFTAAESRGATLEVLHTFFVAEAHSLWRMAVPALLYTMSNNPAYGNAFQGYSNATGQLLTGLSGNVMGVVQPAAAR